MTAARPVSPGRGRASRATRLRMSQDSVCRRCDDGKGCAAPLHGSSIVQPPRTRNARFVCMNPPNFGAKMPHFSHEFTSLRPSRHITDREKRAGGANPLGLSGSAGAQSFHEPRDGNRKRLKSSVAHEVGFLSPHQHGAKAWTPADQRETLR